jgi:hypothetical protein
LRSLDNRSDNNKDQICIPNTPEEVAEVGFVGNATFILCAWLGRRNISIIESQPKCCFS